jgi:hypothetical protein
VAQTTEFSDEQVTFTLAMLSYRGTQNVGIGPLNDFLLRTALDQALETVEPVRGNWEVVWGPVTYAAPFTLFADSAAFVVRDRRQPARLCVVIRGTNPLSAFDWIYGDLWTNRVVPWHWGDRSAPGAAISLSSALGLSIITNMRWFEFPTFGLRALADELSRRALAPVEWIAHQLISPLRSTLAGLFGSAKGELLRDLGAIRAEGADLSSHLEARLQFYERLRDSPHVRRTRTRVDRSLSNAVGAAEIDLFQLMEGVQRTRAAFHPGQSLIGFLTGEVRRAERLGVGPLEVLVTGHSKGGSLAPVVAQWLSDTRHSRRVAWNPERDATIRCFAFAGPTPGNRAFARLYDETLGPRGHRISNRNDLAPHAWAVPSRHFEPHLDLLQIPDISRSALAASPQTHALLEDVAVRIADEVRPLAYAHTGGSVRVFEGKIDEKHDFFGHVLTQHTTAYIQELGLERHLKLSDMGTPL